MSRTPDSPSLREAARIADEVLFPAALEVDTADRVPVEHLDLLAEKGFYGLAAPGGLSALDLPDYASVCRAVETLAGGCLTTTLVWMQHHGAVSAAANTANPAVRDRYLEDLASGRRRAGVAVTAAVRPGPPMLRAEAVDGGWVLDGNAPWVTGWDMIDTLYVAGRDETDTLVLAMIDATEGESLAVEPPLDMVAASASRTVTMHFSRYFVPAERITATMPREQYVAGDHEAVRFNGNLALGVAARAVDLIGDDGTQLAAELATRRDRLTTAEPADVPVARALVSEFALRASAALSTHTGGRSILPSSHAQRLIREATFLLVFGSRPGIRTSLLERFTPSDRGS